MSDKVKFRVNICVEVELSRDAYEPGTTNEEIEKIEHDNLLCFGLDQYSEKDVKKMEVKVI